MKVETNYGADSKDLLVNVGINISRIRIILMIGKEDVSSVVNQSHFNILCTQGIEGLEKLKTTT